MSQVIEVIGENEVEIIDSAGRPTTAHTLTRSNRLIQAVTSHPMPLFSHKLIRVLLANAHLDDRKRLVSEMSIGEIKKVMGLKGNSVHNVVREATDDLLGLSYIYDDEETGSFIGFNVVSEAKYTNNGNQSKFTVVFTDHVIDEVIFLKQKFTSHSVKLLMQYKRTPALKLYEILSTYYWFIRDGYRKQVIVEFEVAELMCKLGLVDMDSPEIKEAMRKKRKDIDWSTIVELSKEIRLKDFSNLKRVALERSIEEMLKYSDCEIIFSYRPNKRGANGRILSLDFIIEQNPNYTGKKATRKKLSKEENYLETIDPRLVQDVKEMLEHHRVTDKEAAAILYEADSNLDLVEQAVWLARKQPELNNLVGFIISAIRGNWEESTGALLGAKQERYDRIKDLQDSTLDSPRMQELLDDWENDRIDRNALTDGELRRLMDALQQKKRKEREVRQALQKEKAEQKYNYA